MIPYLLQDQGTGLLVSPNDKKAMLGAIKKLLQNTELTENLSQNARYQSQKFDWEIVKKEWKEVLLD
mgnify:FL=1